MLNLVILATTLWVCPGDVFSNEPREGCKPFQESNKEGFSSVPEPKQDPAMRPPSQMPSSGLQPSGTSRQPQAAFPPGAPGTAPVIIEQGRPSASPETCALWNEWVSLYTKSDRGGLNAPELTTDEFQRWEKIRYMFTTLNPPNCP